MITLANGSVETLTHNNCDDFAPVWSPDGTQFVFYSTCDGNREIYTMDIEGVNRNRLTSDNATDWFPAWSNDGQNITFSSNRSGGIYQVFVMDPDGSNQQVLAQGCASFFSPDDQQIVFLSVCQGSGDIFVMDMDRGNIFELTTTGNNRAPSWSPDGEWIVFQREVSANDFDIYIMDKDGGNETQITSGPAIDAAPVWQP